MGGGSTRATIRHARGVLTNRKQNENVKAGGQWGGRLTQQRSCSQLRKKLPPDLRGALPETSGVRRHLVGGLGQNNVTRRIIVGKGDQQTIQSKIIGLTNGREGGNAILNEKARRKRKRAEKRKGRRGKTRKTGGRNVRTFSRTSSQVRARHGPGQAVTRKNCPRGQTATLPSDKRR